MARSDLQGQAELDPLAIKAPSKVDERRVRCSSSSLTVWFRSIEMRAQQFPSLPIPVP